MSKRARKKAALAIRPSEQLATREQTERALALADGEDLELAQGMRRGRSGELWTAEQAAAALAGARDAKELMIVTNEILPLMSPGGMGLTSITRPTGKPPWQRALEEHPPDNADEVEK